MGKKGGGKKDAAAGPATISNRRAGYDYQVMETHEAGIVLRGSEVKSLYLGRANLTDAFCRILGGEIWLVQADLEPYKFTTHFLPERRRDRKLLMKRKEIDALERKAQDKGLSLIPLKIYFNDRGRAKVLVGICRGKREFDKRDSIAERETRREADRIRRGQLGD